ncbi:MAG: hypothetical protein A3B70_05690 [Deltaproteobacteria bacterium RIFCSPHIGHO2_02_FULL_40_11]|nr:MAG: hypothetical protein A3B70_05690 [Deltaproteobacteria bacterium RIFCSPHIGHO2_02_FULL_40_11]
MKKTFFVVFIFYILVTPVIATPPGLSPEGLVQKTMDHRRYLKSISVSQTLHFLEGFFTATPFVCQEAISYAKYHFLRIDYICNDIPLTLLQENKTRKIIYNGKIETLEDRPFNFLTALLFQVDEDSLIESLAFDQFIEAQKMSNLITFPDTLKSEKLTYAPSTNTQWHVSGMLSGPFRVGKIEKKSDEKMERNLILKLNTPLNETQSISFDQNLFLPLKIEHKEREVLLSNYKEFENPKERFYRYPQKTEFFEGTLPGILIETDAQSIVVNQPFEKEFYSATQISKNQKGAFPEYLSYMKDTLERFILEYR